METAQPVSGTRPAEEEAEERAAGSFAREKPSLPALLPAMALAAGIAWSLFSDWNRWILPLEVFADAFIAFFAFRLKGEGARWWRIGALALLLGDTFYLVGHNIKTFPEWAFMAQEFFYTLCRFMTGAYLFAAMGGFRDLKAGEKALVAALCAGITFISIQYLLIPYFRSGIQTSAFFYVNSVFNRLAESGVFPLALLLGMKARSRYWLLMTHGVTLISISSLAIGYYIASSGPVGIPVQEYGWLFGLLLVLAAQAYDSSGTGHFARWSSARVRLVWLVLVSNLALLLALYSIQTLISRDAFQLTSILFIFFGLWLVANILSFRISEDMHLMLEDVSAGAAPLTGGAYRVGIYEAELFADKLKAAHNTIRSQARLSALSALAAQVAHDIRSPLAALDSALKDASQLPEEKRLLIRGAAGRIRDIANDLLEKNSQDGSSPGRPRPGRNLEPLLLSSLIEPVVTEKRLQYRDRMDVEIESDLGPDSYGLFARVEAVELGRVLSNLVNNSVEALEGRGQISVSMARRDGLAVITVRDNGKGIPPETLRRLGARGETYGKKGGSGLGLHHAREAAEAWKGSLAISSEAGKGTAVEISLPLAEPPGWFVPALEFAPGARVAILDDDTGIHQVWKGRFESARLGAHGIKIYDFSAPDTLRRWFRAQGSARPAACLFDFELSGHSETGLDLAAELGVADITVLVTSRYEEPRVREACLSRGIRLIPKNLVGLVPLSVAAPAVKKEPAAALLDDDALVLMNWRAAARAAGVNLRAFGTSAEFLPALEGLPLDTPLYIDSDLGGGEAGEKIAEALRARGFTDITLATGHSPEKFASLPWLKVRGKEPPWMPRS